MNFKQSLIVFGAMIVSMSAHGGICVIEDTPKTCIDKYVAKKDAKNEESKKKAQGEKAGIAKRAGGNSPGLPQSVNPTVNDFLSTFQFNYDEGGLDDKDESLSFELTKILPIALDGLKASAGLQNSEPYMPLIESISEESRESVRSAFSERLGDFDDIQISLSYALSNKYFGRNHANHSEIFLKVIESRESKGPGKGFLKVDDRFQDLRGAALKRLCLNKLSVDPEHISFSVFDKKDDDIDSSCREATRGDNNIHIDGAMVLAAYEKSIEEDIKDLEKLQIDLRQQGFYDLIDLVDNQPQFYVSLKTTQRDELTGPDESSIKIAYELGINNLNSLRRFARKSETCGERYDFENSTVQGSDQDKVKKVDLGDCIRAYKDKTKTSVLNDGRVVFAAEYTRRERYDVEFTEPIPISFEQASRSELKVNLAYGRYVKFLEGDTGDSRVDFGVAYVDVSDDPMRNDRGLAELTFSQKIADSYFLSFGFVYSNRPEFRGDVDQELSARVGFNYKYGVLE